MALRTLKRRDLGARSRTTPAPRPRRREVRQLALPILGERTLLVYQDGELAEFPKTRGECVDGPRPCPWVRCRYSLVGEVKDNGALKLYRPDLELEDHADTCVLDVADRGQAKLEDIGQRLNIVQERVRQIAQKAKRQIEREVRKLGLQEDDE